QFAGTLAQGQTSVATKITSAIKWFLKKVAKLVGSLRLSCDHVSNAISFFFLMLKDEETAVNHLRTSYDPPQNLKLFIHHMMDMRYGFPKADGPYYEFY